MSDVDFVLQNNKESLSDLHILYTHDQLDLDTKTYAEICTALLVCSQAVETAVEKQKTRREELLKNYESNTRPTISEPLQKDPE